MIKNLKDYTLDGKFYFKDKEFKVTKENISKVWGLNEKGFITPLTLKDYMELKENLYNRKEFKEEK